ncbi:galactose-1-phosphate uridylyltransferase [Candidatus Woesearchaeota archaeon]|nr:galactose-1-phosphate uridylyltransferase [Candidatus Woesearchaeota archaeon]
MGIIRKDYLLDRWVYYATERKKRPHEFKKVEVKEESKICFFCPDNEHLTPPEIGRLEYKGAWKMRWFLNKFPAVERKGMPNLKSKKFLSESDSYGMHEIIVETQHHKSQLADLPADSIRQLLEVCGLRIKELGRLKGIKYVQVFKNHGKDAGTSLLHSHTQVTALPQIPSLVMEEAKAAKKYVKCPYCDIIKLESKSKRRIIETKNVVAFAPFASRFNYEAWVFVKRHKMTMEEFEDIEYKDLALVLKKILVKLKKINVSYNFFLHYSPQGEDLHFHIEVAPRMATWGGFEISTDAIINSVLPEDAAKFYRR